MGGQDGGQAERLSSLGGPGGLTGPVGVAGRVEWRAGMSGGPDGVEGRVVGGRWIFGVRFNLEQM